MSAGTPQDPDEGSVALGATAASARRTPPDWAEPVVRHPVRVAVLVVITCALLCWRVGLRADLAAFVYLGAVGGVLTVIDIALHRLPDPLTLSSYPVVLALLGLAAPVTEDGGTRYVHALVGMLALFLLFAVQWLIVPSGLGLGDVKLSGVLGLCLGWLGGSAWTLGVLAMFVLGGLYAIGLLVTRRAGRGSTIPFGPFMLGGTLVAVLAYAGG